ncbi:hypothetical protein LX15_000429 [Streptoalloteichus tenebrarius]|uniref:SAV-6107-like HEPN domain-containing protein n=1 Tax=Streptoalloteichus tenebrarius (strain ATCC 17920 / DSM 40477 / JCM 4838 / CBS 697.72 / NBRC 16177 / NCIMB 11028 / NRRL B-12390 / A12253. 1 / ISP 5477) TaxID=1933 RepID=A0ABT1HMJ8_STRSD|nr:SAV_6107 family HEPN domain-containing protein [Streptoalloteichus tenebrarius]MCP2256746.1 hypothetical protein [Streptoalloteichus tenebrarius]BFF00351.1 hypothetical protein GCM10020241_20260 [Streptoalloteichus tenebrarius]
MAVPLDFSIPAPRRGDRVDVRPRPLTRDELAVRPLPPPAALSLLAQAHRGLAEAELATRDADRYTAAHLAALRAAAAVLAVRARPLAEQGRPTSAWKLLASVAPELREWAAFFAAGARTRSLVQAGITRLVSTRDADDMVRQVGQFVELAERAVHGVRP